MINIEMYYEKKKMNAVKKVRMVLEKKPYIQEFFSTKKLPYIYYLKYVFLRFF